MKYVPTTGWEDGVADLTERLVRELANGKRVLWLTSGGSNIPGSVQIIGNIASKLRANLSIMLADERYGRPGHHDSNWAQLERAGFQAEPATLLPVLQTGLSFEAAREHYNQLAEQAFADNNVVIAQLGIGEQGDLAGIQPDSPAAVETDQLVVGYKNTPFKRLTLSFNALRRINAAYVFAFGNTKHRALSLLHDQTVPPSTQPAQILKELPEAYVYTDQIGGRHP